MYWSRVQNVCCPFHSVGHVASYQGSCAHSVWWPWVRCKAIFTLLVRDNVVNFELFMLQLQRISFCTDLELTNLYHTKAVWATSGSRESGVYSVQRFAGIMCLKQWHFEHVVLHVCKCVFIVYMGRWVCVGLIAGKSVFHASKIKFHMF